MVSRFIPAPVTVDLSKIPSVLVRGLVGVVAAPFWLLGAAAALIVVVLAIVARGVRLGYRDVVGRWGS